MNLGDFIDTFKKEVSRLVEDQCFGLNEIENIRHDTYLHGEAITPERCRYHMGENFLLTIFHSLGQETVLSALSELYRSRNVTEESAYRTFLKHVPHDHKEEYRIANRGVLPLRSHVCGLFCVSARLCPYPGRAEGTN